MGNSSSSILCKTCLVSSSSSSSSSSNNQHKAGEIVNSDGKILTTFKTPILVKDALATLSGCDVIGLSKEANSSESIGPEFKLEIGKVYHAILVPNNKRVKLVITKQQLKELLANQISFEEVLLLGLDQKKNKNLKIRKSSLESIPEEIEWFA